MRNTESGQFVLGWMASAFKLQVTTRRLIQEKTRAFVEERAVRRKMPTSQIPGKKKGISSLFLRSPKTDSMGKVLTWESPIAEHARSLFPLYQYFYDGRPRQIHGIAHVCRVALWVEKWYALYQQYDADFTLTDEELKITQLAALWHDSARADDGEDFWDNESATFFFTYLVADMQLPIEKAKEYAEIIANKDFDPVSKKVWRIQLDEETGQVSWDQQDPLPLGESNERLERMRVLLHEADCLDIIRCESDFDKSYLYFFEKYEANHAALRDLQALCLMARGMIFQMGDLLPYDKPRIAEGFNQPSCGHLVRQLCDDRDYRVIGVGDHDDYVRGIANLTMLRGGMTGADVELEKSIRGNIGRSCTWLMPGGGEALFSSVGLRVRPTEIREMDCNDTGTGYGDDKRSEVTAMSHEDIRAAKSEIKRDRCKKKPTCNSIKIDFKWEKFLPYNEVTATIKASEIYGVVYTKDPTWAELDDHSYSLLDAMYLQWLVKERLGIEVPVYEYSGLRQVYEKRFEGMVTEEQAIMEFRDKIRRFFNKDVNAPNACQIEALFTTHDPVKMKSLVCYGKADEIDTLSNKLRPLSSPDQWLSQAAQDKLSELIVMKKWEYAYKDRLPMIKRKVSEESWRFKLSFFDIKMMIENQEKMGLHDKIIEKAINSFIQHDNRCYSENNVVGSPLYQLVQYLLLYQKTHPQFWRVLIEKFMTMIKGKMSRCRFFSISDDIHYFCQKSGLIDDGNIAALLKQKREGNFRNVCKDFKALIPIEKPDGVHSLCISLKFIERIFENEDDKGTTLFEGTDMTFLTAIRDMKNKLAERILDGLGSIFRYNMIETYVYLFCNKNRVLDDTFLSLIEAKLRHVEGNEMHFRLLYGETTIFTSGSDLSLILLKRMIDSLSLASDVARDFKLVFDTPHNNNLILFKRQQSIFNILYDLVLSDVCFMEKNPALLPWFLQKSDELWVMKMEKEGWNLVDGDSKKKAKGVISGILWMAIRDIKDDIFSKIADVFPSGPCEIFIEAVDFLVTKSNQSVFKEIFSSKMHRSLIKMMERIFSVQSVTGNVPLQRKIQRLLENHSDKLPYALKSCMEKKVVANPPLIPSLGIFPSSGGDSTRRLDNEYLCKIVKIP